MIDIKREVANADLIIVGAGFFGSVMANKVGEDLGLNVLLIDKRPHIGGNSFSFVDEQTGIEIHKYGTHIFHTSNKTVWDYVNKFSEFTQYRHSVYTNHNGNLFQMPINLHTFSQFYGKSLSPSEARNQLPNKGATDSRRTGDNLEDRAISMIGSDLYEAFIKGYTHKQWNTDPRHLPAEIFSRLPVRFDLNSRYFDDAFEGLPKEGYTRIFEKMLEKSTIRTLLDTDFFKIRDLIPTNKIVLFTGPIDKFFDFKHGRLGWRTIDLTFERVTTKDFQGSAVVNEADIEVPYTRTHEWKHLRPDLPSFDLDQTIISREFSRFATELDEPYYPVNSSDDRLILAKYRSEAANLQNVFFGGRLGTYMYLDMHMAIASALVMFEQKVKPALIRQKAK